MCLFLNIYVHSPGMYMFTVCVGIGQFVCMLDGENVIGLHHKISQASL